MATKFKDFMAEIEAEARAEGPEAVAELDMLRTHFRLGRQLAAARRTKHLTQKQLAERAGIDQADVSEIERGAANPTLNKLEAIASAMDLQLNFTARRTRSSSTAKSSRRTSPRAARHLTG